MHVTSRKEWLEVCAEAALSEDPERFHELINEINSILRREQQRLHALQTYNFHALAPSDQDPKQ